MKKLFKLVGVLSLVLVFAFAPMMVAFAAPAAAHAFQEPAPVTLPDLVKTLETLGGFAMLVAALTNALKKLGWVSDGNAPSASLVFNALGLVGLIALQLTGKFDSVPVIDSNAGSLAVAINAVIALIFQLYTSRKVHEEALAGLPLIGKSHSGRHAGENGAIEVDIDD